jgi:hypothetical protein
MDILTISLIVAVIVFIIAWAVALNGEAKMKITAESAIMRNTELAKQFDTCRGCGKPLSMKNWNVADGCPCNSTRGVNHGLVPMLTCTCKECDPDQTGGTRDAKTMLAKNEELEALLESEKKLAKNRLELATTYGNKIEELEKDRDQYKSLAVQGERTIQDQAKKIEELTKGDANGEVTRGKRGRFASKKAS